MMPSLIAHSRPWITDEDIQAVSRQLQTGMIGQGAACSELEQRMARWIGASEGVAAGSGTAAIVLALKALEIQPADEVLLPTYVCVSLYEAVLTSGAKPVLCDVGNDWVMTAQTAARAVTPKTRAIIVPHLYGIFADVQAIRELGIPVIEDLAQAVAGESSRSFDGDIAVFSFHPTKCLTAGEGGVAVASDPSLVERMRLYRDGGRSKPAARLFSPLSDLSAALALSQLSRYPEMLRRRRLLADRYRRIVLETCPGAMNGRAFKNSMFFRFPVLVEGGLSFCEDQFLERGVIVRQGVDQLLHRLIELDDKEFPSAVNLFERTVSLPIYPALTAEEEKRCIQAASEIFTGTRYER